MKLTKKDKEILGGWGNSGEDIRQIEEAIGKTAYGLENGEEIPCREAARLLGREEFLSGISRSAFHWSAERHTEDGRAVSFDSSEMFQ